MTTKISPDLHRTLLYVKDASQTLRQPGVYALWCQEGTSKRLLSVRPSDNLQRSIRSYDALLQLRVHSGNRITFSVKYMPGSSARERETAARLLARRAEEPWE